MLIALEDHFGKAHKEIDHFAVGPAAILLHQVQGHLEVGESDHRLDVVFQQLVEHVVVELQSLFIRLGFVTLREDAGPGDRGAEAFEAISANSLMSSL